MKKYIKLQKHEELADGDECRYVYSEEWRPNVHSSQFAGFEYRRPVPYSGKVAFLVTYSPVIRVVIDTTGLNDEQIDEKLIDAARSKFKVYREHHINEFGDNIDWERTKEDTEVPFVEPEPKNPGKYRYLEVGEVIETGDELFKIDLAQFEPIENGFEWLIGAKFSRAMNQVRRPIANQPRYRPFLEGEIMEMGDQFRFDKSSEWRDLTEPFTTIADDSIIRSGNFRKLIK